MARPPPARELFFSTRLHTQKTHSLSLSLSPQAARASARRLLTTEHELAASLLQAERWRQKASLLHLREASAAEDAGLASARARLLAAELAIAAGAGGASARAVAALQAALAAVGGGGAGGGGGT